MLTEWALKLKLVMASEIGDRETRIAAIDAATDEGANAGLCRQRHDVSGLGALRTEATLHAMRRGCITKDKAAADLTKWGLL